MGGTWQRVGLVWYLAKLAPMDITVVGDFHAKLATESDSRDEDSAEIASCKQPAKR